MATLPQIELTDLTVQLTSPMQIGTGYARGLIDRTVMRGRDGLVYIPGSTLKGKLRDACESLAQLSGIATCRAPYPAKMAKNRHRENCLVCRIFGAPALPSTLRWHQASLIKDWADALRPEMDKEAIYGQTWTRTQVQLSRKRGVSAEARLFTSELAAENMAFEASPAVTGRLELTPMTLAEEDNVYYELVLLLAGFKMIQALGGGRSRGTGQCEISLPKTLRVNNQEIQVAHQLNNVEGLSLYWDEREAIAP